MVAITSALIGYDQWAGYSIRKQLVSGDVLISLSGRIEVVNIPILEIMQVSTIIIGNCSPEYFWGHFIYYSIDSADKTKPANYYMRHGHVCRDWQTEKWILVQNAR